MTRRVVITEKPTRLNTGCMVQKLRRIRSELALMLQQADDALDRIEKEKS